MPNKLLIPEIKDIDLIDDIVSERTRNPNKAFFNGYEADWKKRVNEYTDKCGNPEKINVSTIQEEDKSRFINLYTAPTGIVRKDIIDVLRDHSLAMCPFCSEAGRPTTLDHFLPKDTYPEYSLLSANLVPACDACQGVNAKGAKALDAEGRRLFLHPYYDIPEGAEIIILTIKAPYDKGSSFNLSVNDELDTDLKELCVRHIKELNIEGRFRRWFKSEYLRLKKLVLSLLEEDDDPDMVLMAIRLFYRKNKLMGVNYWDTVFYKAVLSNSDLLEFLKDKENLRI